jgi:hypothetical protein
MVQLRPNHQCDKVNGNAHGIDVRGKFPGESGMNVRDSRVHNHPPR